MIHPPKQDESQISSHGNPFRFRFPVGRSRGGQAFFRSEPRVASAELRSDVNRSFPWPAIFWLRAITLSREATSDRRRDAYRFGARFCRRIWKPIHALFPPHAHSLNALVK